MQICKPPVFGSTYILQRVADAFFAPAAKLVVAVEEFVQVSHYLSVSRRCSGEQWLARYPLRQGIVLTAASAET